MPRCNVAAAAAAAAKTISSPPTPTPTPTLTFTPAAPLGRAVRSRGRRHGAGVRSCSAKKPPDELERGSPLAGVLSSRSVLLRSGAALFALGFVDAGYSGDWSRIGAISKDTEELLKLGAYAVVPLCLAFIFSASEDGGSKKS